MVRILRIGRNLVSSMSDKIVISGTGLFTPSQSVSNEELVDTFNAYVDIFNKENAEAIEAGDVEALEHSSVAFIEKASGIKSRFVMDKEGVLDPTFMRPRIPERSDEDLSILAEMAVAAAKQAIEAAGKKPEDIQAVICAASNMQRAYPAMAVEVQEALGIQGFGFDMNVACSSATFGIQTLYDMLKAGSIDCALMVNPEICSGHLDFKDRDCHFIFGDVATAVVLEREDTCTVPNAFEIVGTKLKTQFSNNIRNNFGFLNNSAPEGIGARDKLFKQEGRKVFREVVPMVAEMILEHIGENDLDVSEVKRLWLHQANQGMNDLISKKVLGREPSRDEAPVILDEYANTSSAGSIIAFHKYQDDLSPGDLALICSFGAGYSAGSVLVRKRA